MMYNRQATIKPITCLLEIERWFRSLKTEEIYLNEYPNPRALRKAISVYIQQYNTVRPHQALEYKTPESVYQSCFASQGSYAVRYGSKVAQETKWVDLVLSGSR